MILPGSCANCAQKMYSFWVCECRFSLQHLEISPSFLSTIVRERTVLDEILKLPWRNVRNVMKCLPYSHFSASLQLINLKGWCPQSRSGTPYHPFCCQILQLLVKDRKVMPEKKSMAWEIAPQFVAIFRGKMMIDHWIWGTPFSEPIYFLYIDVPHKVRRPYKLHCGFKALGE